MTIAKNAACDPSAWVYAHYQPEDIMNSKNKKRHEQRHTKANSIKPGESIYINIQTKNSMIRKINERFEHQGNIYQVLETECKYPNKCQYCGFFDHIDKQCRGTLRVTGDCRRRRRRDKKEVVFIEW